jgi:hypothetical protein
LWTSAAFQRRRTRPGFTLLEALLALVIFTIISFAMSLAISAVFQAQAAAQKREDEATTIRAVFGFLTRDLQAAFISPNNPAAVFIAEGSQSGGIASRTSGGSTGSLLMLTTLAHRITMEDPTVGLTGTPNPDAPAVPQADFELVRYDIDPASGTLFRTVSAVPNLETVGQPQPTPQSLLAERIIALNLRFWDAEQKAFRNEWDYQQENQAQESGDPGTGLPGETPVPAMNTATGDTALPAAVEVTLIMQRKDGSTATFMTMIPVVAPRPSQTPAQPTTNPTGGTGGTGAPGGGGGNTPPGGNPGGAPNTGQ